MSKMRRSVKSQEFDISLKGIQSTQVPKEGATVGLDRRDATTAVPETKAMNRNEQKTEVRKDERRE